MTRYAFRSPGSRGGKYHLPRDPELAQRWAQSNPVAREHDFRLPDEGLCGRLDPDARFPHVIDTDSFLPEAVCGDCQRIEQSDTEGAA